MISRCISYHNIYHIFSSIKLLLLLINLKLRRYHLLHAPVPEIFLESGKYSFLETEKYTVSKMPTTERICSISIVFFVLVLLVLHLHPSQFSVNLQKKRARNTKMKICGKYCGNMREIYVVERGEQTYLGSVLVVAPTEILWN